MWHDFVQLFSVLLPIEPEMITMVIITLALPPPPRNKPLEQLYAMWTAVSFLVLYLVLENICMLAFNFWNINKPVFYSKNYWCHQNALLPAVLILFWVKNNVLLGIPSANFILWISLQFTEQIKYNVLSSTIAWQILFLDLFVFGEK